MSWTSDSSQRIAGFWTSSAYPGNGITGAELRAKTATGTDGPGALYGDWADGDDAKEFRWTLVTPPSAGAFTTFEDGSFSFAGAPDGDYTAVYRLTVDGVDRGTATLSLKVGAILIVSIAGAGAIDTSEAFGSPVVVRRAPQTVLAGSIDTSETFGVPTVARKATLAILTQSIASSEAFGTPSVVRKASVLISAQSLASSESFGTPTVATYASITLTPVSIASSEGFGVPVVLATLDGEPPVLDPDSAALLQWVRSFRALIDTAEGDSLVVLSQGVLKAIGPIPTSES